jgi:hypothetical protein
MITTLEQVKLVLGITTDTKDTLIEALIPLVEADYLFIRNKAFDTDDEGAIVYPIGSEGVAIRMIGYQLNVQGQQGVSAESLSRHSITYQVGTGTGAMALYPASISAGIKRYAEFV